MNLALRHLNGGDLTVGVLVVYSIHVGIFAIRPRGTSGASPSPGATALPFPSAGGVASRSGIDRSGFITGCAVRFRNPLTRTVRPTSTTACSTGLASSGCTVGERRTILVISGFVVCHALSVTATIDRGVRLTAPIRGTAYAHALPTAGSAFGRRTSGRSPPIAALGARDIRAANR
ncbi:MAG TPA: hypothetical protein VML56_14700 [Burkholderiales bacterium]|nr:hypothetical protein [Burkholderiales bacterium]